jgi:hypothetical protein
MLQGDTPVTDAEALALAFERAAGVCECIGGGCPALTHRPGVNRCSAPLRAAHATAFFTVARFADRTNPENIFAVCPACAENPRRHAQRLPSPTAPFALAGEESEESPS